MQLLLYQSSINSINSHQYHSQFLGPTDESYEVYALICIPDHDKTELLISFIAQS